MKKLGLTDILETERCILKIPEESEAREIWDLISTDTCAYIQWDKGIDNSETLKKVREARKNAENFDGWDPAIFDKITGECIGRCGVVRIDKEISSFEIGYWIGERFYGKGIVPECVNKFVEVFFEELGFEKGIIICDEGNINSAKVAKKCGFELEGILKKSDRMKGRLCNMAHYGITREQYFSQK